MAPNNTLVILEARETVGGREETGVAAADAASLFIRLVERKLASSVWDSSVVVVIADILGGRLVLDDVKNKIGLVPEGDDSDPDEEVRLSFPKDENFMRVEAAMVRREVVVDDEHLDKGCWRRPKWPVFLSMGSTISRIIPEPSRNHKAEMILSLFHGGCAGSPESSWIG